MNHKFPLTLLFTYLAFWTLGTINPLYPHDWLLENLLPAIFIPLLVITYRRFRFTNASYLLIFLFMSSHVLGSHYTYAEVPYDRWAQSLFGFSINDVLGFERNHFDRLIHFSYGALLLLPCSEWLAYILGTGRRVSGWLALQFVLATSVLYELLEWAVAELFGGDLGMAFLGIQGDIWDAHWDMMLAGSGALLALVVMYWRDRQSKKSPA